MTNSKNIRRALLSSVLALVMCFAMLLTTTFAWFTDTVTSADNKIAAGTLDVELRLHNDDGSVVNISESNAPIFGTGALAQNNAANTLWEPGKTQTVYLSICNNGTLDLKYKVAIEVFDVVNNLTDVVEYIITPDAQNVDGQRVSTLDWENGNAVVSGVNVATVDVPLKAGGVHYFALSVHMDELAGNDYQNGSISFDIKVLATQLASESDSLGSSYDDGATYPDFGSIVEVPTDEVYPTAGLPLEAYNEQGDKVATALVPSSAVADNAKTLGFNVDTTTPDANIVIAAGYEALAYDVSVSGLKADNDVPVKVELRIPAGLDPNTVVVYHYDQPISSTYDSATGLVTFETATFSPFTCVYDPASTPDNSVDSADKLPTATVTDVTADYVDYDYQWGNYGGWSPDPAIDADPSLECVFQFVCDETAEEAKLNAYANWYCDFYVKLDTDLGENQIFLGGNYGDFGWVGFHNGEVVLGANEEIPLLGSVTSSPWTYADIANFVGTFTCGVADVDNQLVGSTFTVTLRLTNPDNANEYYDVVVINHLFE